MKMLKSLFATGAIALSLQLRAECALIAYWNFNGLTTSTNNGTSYAPNSGSATLTLSGWTATATTGITAFAGTTGNALNSDPAGQALALQGGTTSGTPNNGATLLIVFSMTDLEDPVVSFSTRNTSTGFNNNQVAYSTNGTDFTNFATYSMTTSFETKAFDFSAVNALDDVATAYFRITFLNASNNSGNNRIDNIQINAVPEPGAALLGTIGLLGLLRRRR